jgi:hypothetical protein
MDAARFSETLVFYNTTLLHNPEDFLSLSYFATDSQFVLGAHDQILVVDRQL